MKLYTLAEYFKTAVLIVRWDLICGLSLFPFPEHTPILALATLRYQ